VHYRSQSQTWHALSTCIVFAQSNVALHRNALALRPLPSSSSPFQPWSTTPDVVIACPTVTECCVSIKHNVVITGTGWTGYVHMYSLCYGCVIASYGPRLPVAPGGLCMSGDDDVVLISLRWHDWLYKLDLRNDTMTSLRLSAHGRRLSVQRIDCARDVLVLVCKVTNEVLVCAHQPVFKINSSFTVQQQPSAMRVCPDGTAIAMLFRDSLLLSVLSLNGVKLWSVSFWEPVASSIYYRFDGRLLYVHSASATVDVLHGDTVEVEDTVQLPATAAYVSGDCSLRRVMVLPDDRLLTVYSDHGEDLTAILVSRGLQCRLDWIAVVVCIGRHFVRECEG
jgi:hypothetical protein